MRPEFAEKWETLVSGGALALRLTQEEPGCRVNGAGFRGFLWKCSRNVKFLQPLIHFSGTFFFFLCPTAEPPDVLWRKAGGVERGSHIVGEALIVPLSPDLGEPFRGPGLA